jgi:hypothetical protein
MPRFIDGSSTGQPVSGFAYDLQDEVTSFASVKRISPAYDNDCDLGSTQKRFKSINVISINGGTVPTGGFLQ